MASTELIETLRLAQRLGFFGPRPIEEAAEHSQAYVAALGPLPDGSRLADLGSGGGLPGLVLAEAYPDVDVVLVERRTARADFLARAVSRLGFARVTVRPVDVSQMIAEVADGRGAPFDVVTARGFGPPLTTARVAAGLLRPGGRLLVSEPPAGERWDPDAVSELGFSVGEPGRVRVLRRFT